MQNMFTIDLPDVPFELHETQTRTNDDPLLIFYMKILNTIKNNFGFETLKIDVPDDVGYDYRVSPNYKDAYERVDEVNLIICKLEQAGYEIERFNDEKNNYFLIKRPL